MSPLYTMPCTPVLRRVPGRHQIGVQGHIQVYILTERTKFIKYCVVDNVCALLGVGPRLCVIVCEATSASLTPVVTLSYVIAY